MRSVVVLSADGELAVALRERLPRAWVTVLDAGDDPMSLVTGCRPWPWMLAGDVGGVPAGVLDLVRSRPVLLRWLGATPAGMPAHCRVMSRFGDLAASVSRALTADVGGVRLAVGTGVVIGGGVHVNAELEALVGESPLPLDVAPSRFRAAAALLRRCAPGVRIVAAPQGVRLEAA